MGKEAQRGPAYHQRLLPAHTQLKVRQPGQGGDADSRVVRDLRAELLEAESLHFAKLKGGEPVGSSIPEKRSIDTTGPDGEEDLRAKRIRILMETRDIDADSGGGSDEEDSSEEDR